MRALVRALWAVGAAAAAGVAFVALGADVRSPHGQTEGCFLCHEPAADGARPEAMTFAAGSADEACKACHGEDPHEVGLEPRRAQVPAQMTLVNGRLACLSCHDEPACDGHEVSEEDPYFFRGGPYESVGGLCAQCHQVTGTERFNPHRAMADRPDDSEMCEHCHLEVPAPDATEADLKVDGPNICLGCHVETPHAGAQVHLGPVPEPMREAVAASGLPITMHGEIVCLTCHDPHPGRILERSAKRAAGVGQELFPQRWLDSVLVPALKERGDLAPKHLEPDFLNEPLAGGVLCEACHTPQATERLREEER